MAAAIHMVAGVRAQADKPRGRHVVGYLEGEGVGPEVVREALRALAALESATGCRFELRKGGLIGREAQSQCGRSLPEEVVEFCEDVFSTSGAVLAGPGGGRFVYDLRKRFDLFCKISPIKTFEVLAGAGRLRPGHARGVDMLLVRENCSDVYLGSETEAFVDGGRRLDLRFSCSESQVQRIVDVGARLAAHRRGKMTVVVKTNGVPLLTALWKDCAQRAAAHENVGCEFMDVDYAAYRLVQVPHGFDIVVAPNLFGDILADLCGVLLGSRGLTHSGNFSADGAAVYQTNHGAAYDLAGTDRANPVGQILSLAMLLRESFGLARDAGLIESAVADVWQQGWRTEDLAEDACRVVGTRRMGELVAAAVQDALPGVPDR
jgi:3-isopropylmalate dehydrogenase